MSFSTPVSLRYTHAAIILLASLAVSAETKAASFEIRQLNQGLVEIEATDASVDDILLRLGQQHDIRIERVGTPAAPRNWSGRISGRVETVLARLLGSENFLVEHAATAKTGIARVRIFAATPNDEAPSATPSLSAPPERQRPAAGVQPAAAIATPPPNPVRSAPSTRPAVATTTSTARTVTMETAKPPSATIGPASPPTRSQPNGAQRRGGVTP